MSGVIRKKNTGEAWETVLDTGAGGGIPEGGPLTQDLDAGKIERVDVGSQDGSHSQIYTDPADGLLKVKLEDGSVAVIGGSRSVSLTDTADPGQVANITDPFDTRGVGSMGFFLETTSWADPSDYLDIIVLTRIAGRPWMTAAVVVQDDNADGTTLAQKAQINQNGELRYLKIPVIGLQDESLVIVQPIGAGAGAAGLTLDMMPYRAFAGGSAGDWANRIKIEYLNPGVPDNPLSVASDDGWTIIVDPATDGDGVITTITATLDTVLDPSSDIGDVFAINIVTSALDLLTPVAPTPLSGGIAGVTAGITYALTATY